MRFRILRDTLVAIAPVAEVLDLLQIKFEQPLALIDNTLPFLATSTHFPIKK